MKVVESRPWVLRVDCPHCNSVLDIETEDIGARNYAVGYGGETDEWEPYALCAVCKGEIRFKLGKVPLHIFNAAKARAKGYVQGP